MLVYQVDFIIFQTEMDGQLSKIIKINFKTKQIEARVDIMCVTEIGLQVDDENLSTIRRFLKSIINLFDFRSKTR